MTVLELPRGAYISIWNIRLWPSEPIVGQFITRPRIFDACVRNLSMQKYTERI